MLNILWKFLILDIPWSGLGETVPKTIISPTLTFIHTPYKCISLTFHFSLFFFFSQPFWKNSTAIQIIRAIPIGLILDIRYNVRNIIVMCMLCIPYERLLRYANLKRLGGLANDNENPQRTAYAYINHCLTPEGIPLS